MRPLVHGLLAVLACASCGHTEGPVSDAGIATRRRRYRVPGVATPVVARNAQGDLALVVSRNGVETTELLHALDGRAPGAREGWL